MDRLAKLLVGNSVACFVGPVDLVRLGIFNLPAGNCVLLFWVLVSTRRRVMINFILLKNRWRFIEVAPVADIPERLASLNMVLVRSVRELVLVDSLSLLLV